MHDAGILHIIAALAMVETGNIDFRCRMRLKDVQKIKNIVSVDFLKY